MIVGEFWRFLRVNGHIFSLNVDNVPLLISLKGALVSRAHHDGQSTAVFPDKVYY